MKIYRKTQLEWTLYTDGANCEQYGVYRGGRAGTGKWWTYSRETDETLDHGSGYKTRPAAIAAAEAHWQTAPVYGMEEVPLSEVICREPK